MKIFSFQPAIPALSNPKRPNNVFRHSRNLSRRYRPRHYVCIGIAIDSMIHLVFGVRRAEADGKKGWATWVAARQEQWRGIVYSDLIIATGFAIFVLSDFLPTNVSEWWFWPAALSIFWRIFLSCRYSQARNGNESNQPARP
jgi:hypothetical protein